MKLNEIFRATEYDLSDTEKVMNLLDTGAVKPPRHKETGWLQQTRNPEEWKEFFDDNALGEQFGINLDKVDWAKIHDAYYDGGDYS